MRLRYCFTKEIICVILFGLLAFCPVTSFAYELKMLKGEEVVLVNEPAVSQFFYGELKGNAQVFRIETADALSAYVNILVPERSNAAARYSASIYKVNEGRRSMVFLLSASSSPWARYLEPFAHDYYLKGPEFRADFPRGVYEVEVSGNENAGRYVLAVGEQERFNFSEAARSVYYMRELKASFFESPLYSYIFSYYGSILFVLSLAIGAGIAYLTHVVGLRFIALRRRRPNQKNIGLRDRIIRAVVALLFMALAFISPFSAFFLVLSGFFIYESLAHFCVLYLVFSKNTCRFYEFA